jgi:Family of unknown function (DUF6535)
MDSLAAPELEPTAAGIRTALTGGQAPNAGIDGEYFHGMVKENTAWDVYNNEAKKVDNELVKDWTASLNFLLVFVSTVPSPFSCF